MEEDKEYCPNCGEEISLFMLSRRCCSCGSSPPPSTEPPHTPRLQNVAKGFLVGAYAISVTGFITESFLPPPQDYDGTGGYEIQNLDTSAAEAILNL